MQLEDYLDQIHVVDIQDLTALQLRIEGSFYGKINNSGQLFIVGVVENSIDIERHPNWSFLYFKSHPRQKLVIVFDLFCFMKYLGQKYKIRMGN